MQTPAEDEGDDDEEQEAEDEVEEEEDEEEDDEDGDDEGAEDSPGAGMKLAACAVDFNVGFFADQASGFEGISHFLEHMVFMGSEKYPGENHFSDWLSQHWGSACGFRADHVLLRVSPETPRGGLDIFAGTS